VTVKASDGTLFSTQDLTVNLADVNDRTPGITSAATFTVPENHTVVGTVVAADGDGTAANNTVSYSISGGADAAWFAIDADTGTLSFAAAPDYETGQHSFAVTVKASDGTLFSTQDLTVNLTDVNDYTPAITSARAITAAEQPPAVGPVVAADGDGTAANNTVSYS